MLSPKLSRVLLPRKRLPAISCVRYKAAYEGEGKTTVKILNQEQDLGLMIDAYATYGFRLNNGLTVLGPMAIFPRTVLSWQVQETTEITAASLRLFKMLQPKIDLVVVGVETGDRSQYARVFAAANANNLNIEILPTEHACSTFNFLSAEGRSVAGALIPPVTVTMDDNDLLQHKIHYQDVFNKPIE